MEKWSTAMNVVELIPIPYKLPFEAKLIAVQVTPSALVDILDLPLFALPTATLSIRDVKTAVIEGRLITPIHVTPLLLYASGAFPPKAIEPPITYCDRAGLQPQVVGLGMLGIVAKLT